MSGKPNFFTHYLNFTKDTEPANIFHLWSSISALSALVGKKIYIPHGYFDIFPNLYVILVGPAASRKSSALKIAQNLVETVPTVPLAPASASRESIIDSLVESKISYTQSGKELFFCQLSAFANEFDTFMGGSHLNRGIATFLTDVWDASIYRERTRSSGAKEIANPYFTILGACVPEWFRNQLKEHIISSGFARRIIFVYADKVKKPVAIPTKDSLNIDAWVNLKLEAARIHSICGTMTLSKDTITAHTKFYDDLQQNISSYDIRHQNYYSSKHVLVLKVCSLVSCGIDSSRQVTLPVYNFVQNLFTETERSLGKIYNNVGNNPLVGISESIKDFIDKQKKVSRKVLLKTFYSDLINGQQSLDQILSELNQMGYLVGPEVSSNGLDLLYSSTASGVQHQGLDLLQQASQLSQHSQVHSLVRSSDEPPASAVQAAERVATREAAARHEIDTSPLLRGILSKKTSAPVSSPQSVVTPPSSSSTDTHSAPL